MKLYHGTSYDNAISICSEKSFLGNFKYSHTYGEGCKHIEELNKEDGVVYFSNKFDFVNINYCNNEKDCIIAIELDDEYIHSIKEIDSEYTHGDEEEFFADVVDTNGNMKIIGIYDENGEYQEDWEEWCF